MRRNPAPWALALLALISLVCTSPISAQEGTDSGPVDNPRVALETNHGTLVLELFPEEAPGTVENFLAYVEDGFYDGTIFHRVIRDFMIQGGGFTRDMEKKPTRPPIRNEANNGLKNEKGTVAMARTSDPHSATSQFFINVVDNAYLDHTAETSRGWGYTVFGRVVDGMEVVDEIAAVPTGRQGGMSDVPREPVLIEDARRVGGEEAGGPEEEGDGGGDAR